VTKPEPVLTCHYVSDGEVGRRMTRDRRRRMRHPALLGSTVVLGLALGEGASFLSYTDSLPEYLGRVLWIGFVWGVCWIAAVALFTAALVLPLVRWRERRVAAQYPAGSVTEVRLDTYALVILRPSGERSELAYEGIRRVRTFGSLQAIYLRGSRWPELLPTGALTEEALSRLHERMRGAPPTTEVGVTADATRTFAVPAGWAAHVAGVYARANLRRPAFLLRFGLVCLAILVVAVLDSWWWALVVPVLFAVVVLGGYVPTLRMLRGVLPDGSTATSEVLGDRLVYRNASGVREIRYADIRGVDVRGDVVLMRLTTPRGVGVLPRALIPDDLLQRLHGVA
jgi:hypothetical protein